jgi:hypothetical protein
MNNELFTYKFDVESKTYFFDLKENPNGKFLKITELSNGRRNAIIIPERGIEEFIEYLKRTKDKLELYKE